jgi:hypothetical protein
LKQSLGQRGQSAVYLAFRKSLLEFLDAGVGELVLLRFSFSSLVSFQIAVFVCGYHIPGYQLQGTCDGQGTCSLVAETLDLWRQSK